MRIIIEIGDELGHWKVVENPSGSKKNHTKCRCCCGLIKHVYTADLKRGKSRSCADCSGIGDPVKWAYLKSKYKITESLSTFPLRKTYNAMMSRCYNSNCKGFNRYGGRGIGVYSEWKNMFNFFEWSLANGYEQGLTLERVNVDGDYQPNNCKFIPPSLQARNRKKFSNNKTGVTGVCEYEKLFMATWRESGKQKTKAFSKNRYGAADAKKLASEYRADMLASVSEKEEPYGEFHGK